MGFGIRVAGFKRLQGITNSPLLSRGGFRFEPRFPVRPTWIRLPLQQPFEEPFLISKAAILNPIEPQELEIL